MRHEDMIRDRINLLREKVRKYEDYLEVCLEDGDMHGVMDAAVDIREYKATIEALTWVLD